MNVFRRSALGSIGLSALLLIAAASIGSAATFTASGTAGGVTEDAQAAFTLGNGTVGVTITNLLNNPTSAGQLISELSFTIAGATSGTLSSSSAEQIAVTPATNGKNGQPSSATSPTAARSTDWTLSHSSSTFTLNGLVGRQPEELIIGGPGTGATPYSNANSSIGNFNPSLYESATFDLSIPGVTSSSTISNVIFYFGTGPDGHLDGTPTPNPSPVPEPTSILLLGTAFAISAKLLYRRRSA